LNFSFTYRLTANETTILIGKAIIRAINEVINVPYRNNKIPNEDP